MVKSTIPYAAFVALSLTQPDNLLLAKEAEPQSSAQSLTTTAGASRDGLFYSLPRTDLRFQFRLEKTTVKDGTFCDLSGYFFQRSESFDPSQCSDKPVASYQLAPDVSVVQAAKPDSRKQYQVTFGGAFKEQAVTLKFARGNQLTEYNGDVKDKKFEFVTTLVSLAGGFIGRAAGLGAFKKASAAQAKTPTTAPPPRLECASDLDAEDRRLYEGLGEGRQDTACGLEARSRSVYLRLTPELKGTFDSYRAEESGSARLRRFLAAARLIGELTDLASLSPEMMKPNSGNAPLHADAIQTLLKARQDRVKAIEQMFLGTRTVEMIPSPVLEWRLPAESPSGRAEVALIGYSKEGGWCLPGNAGAAPDVKPAEMKDCSNGATLVTACLRCGNGVADTPKPAAVPDAVITQLQQLRKEFDELKTTLQKKTKSPAAPGTGIAYNLPSAERLELRSGDALLLAADYDIPQWGEFGRLPATIGSSTHYEVALDAVTGALRSITVGVQPFFSSGRLDQIGKAGNSLFDAATAIKESREPDTPLETITADRKKAQEELKLHLVNECKADPGKPLCKEVLAVP